MKNMKNNYTMNNTPESTIINVINDYADDRGICTMPTLGSQLRLRGVTKQTLGVEKLSHFLATMPEVEMLDDNNLVRLRHAANKSKAVDNHSDGSIHNPQLVAKWHELLPTVASVARREDWSLGTNPYGVLKRYIIAQFCACLHEDKVLHNQGYATFHTALYDHNFEPIFAILSYTDKMHYKLLGFCRPNTPQAREVKASFGSFPVRARYGTDEERYFDPERFHLDEVAYNHILGNISRFPFSFVQRFCPKGIVARDMSHASYSEQESYDEQFFDALLNDQACMNIYRDLLHGAVTRALRRVEENNAEAVLCYRCDRGCLHHLLPISLNDPDVIDFALMVRREDDGNYFAPTILPVSACRCAARVVGKINNTWLGQA